MHFTTIFLIKKPPTCLVNGYCISIAKVPIFTLTMFAKKNGSEHILETSIYRAPYKKNITSIYMFDFYKHLSRTRYIVDSDWAVNTQDSHLSA